MVFVMKTVTSETKSFLLSNPVASFIDNCNEHIWLIPELILVTWFFYLSQRLCLSGQFIFWVSLAMFLKLANILELTEVQKKPKFFSVQIIYKEWINNDYT